LSPCPSSSVPSYRIPRGFLQDRGKRTRGQRKKDNIAEEKGQNMKRRKDKRTQEE
jgi:hypothetical protein